MRSLMLDPRLPGVRPVSLEGPDLWAQTATGIRAIGYSYSLASRLTGVTRTSRELKLSVRSFKPALFDGLSQWFEASMDAGRPMMLTVDGAWTAMVYVPKTETQSVTPVMADQDWTIVLLDGVWTRVCEPVEFNPVLEDSTGLDLPTDMPYDLAASSMARSVNVVSQTPVDFRMTIYGPVASPHITIGSNRYELTGSIPARGYAAIDSQNRTITLTDQNGDTSNIFDRGVRGDGRGGGSYIFEPIPAGRQEVLWPSSFGFTLRLVEHRSDPTWLD